MSSHTILAPAADGGSQTVIVVDDDPLMRGAMDCLFRSVGYETVLYGSAQDLLGGTFPEGVCCLVLDVRMPGMNGFDFQSRLIERGVQVPIIFVTGHGDIPMGVRAMKTGAVDFLPKPFREEEMLDAVSAAMERDIERRSRTDGLADLVHRFDTLTHRERQVMALVTTGLMNKQVAGELGLSEITVKLHRGTMTKKMGARTLADLVRIAESLSLQRSGDRIG
jgi:FixJ family two-component response regulator